MTRAPGIRCQKGCIAFFSIKLDALNAFPDMNQIEPIILYRGVASASTRSLIYQFRALSLTTSTFRPKRSSRSCIRAIWSIKLVPGSISTRISRSLSGPASPLATEPKTRTFRAPCLEAMARISCRLDFSSSSIFVCICCSTLQYNEANRNLNVTVSYRKAGRRPVPFKGRDECRTVSN